jgi:Asp/Glu/hydantoin racemase
MSRILVVNPNSSLDMTRSIDDGLDLLRTDFGPEIVTTRLEGAPEGIETQLDVEMVTLPLLHRLRGESADAYVIACYSDPGLHVLREQLDRPVLGIGESSLLLALSLGYRFGIVSIGEGSIPRHLRMVRSHGLEHRLAGDISANTGLDFSNDNQSIDRIVAVGKRLRDERGAEALILGCAGMGRYRNEISQLVGLPVIDPTQAAVSRAIGMLALGYRRAR